MKKLLTIILSLFGVIVLSSCGDAMNSKVKLLYSKTLTKPVETGFIESYEDYLESVDFLDLKESFFDTKVLYLYQFNNNQQGRDIYGLKSYEIKNNKLTITMKENDGMASNAFGDYVLAFSISKEYYKEFNDVIVKGVYSYSGLELYKFSVDDKGKFIINKLDDFYYEGDEIVIQTDILTDVGLELYVNGVFHSTQVSVRQNDKYIWEYYLTMPNENVVISFKVVDGFLPFYEELFTTTIAISDYGYEHVYKYAKDIDYEYLEAKYGINANTNYYVIENLEDYYDIFLKLTFEVTEPYIDLEEFVFIYIKRDAMASNFIKVIYSQMDDQLVLEYPFANELGDDAIFSCIDIVRIHKSVYDDLRKDESGKLIIINE